MPDKILNSKKVTGPLTYVVRDNDDILNVDTTLGVVTLVFANIRGSGFNFIQKQYYVNDIGNQASVNNIILQATGGDLVNNNPSIALTQNGASAQVQISSQTEWLATGDTSPVVISDKNFVYTQNIPSDTWIVNHNLNKKVCVNVTDINNKLVQTFIEWVNNNTIIIKTNNLTTGYAYCN